VVAAAKEGVVVEEGAGRGAEEGAAARRGSRELAAALVWCASVAQLSDKVRDPSVFAQFAPVRLTVFTMNARFTDSPSARHSLSAHSVFTLH
jgi:hypothetical protein